LEELLDYFPFGNIRLDQKAGSFDESRKYAGHEYDSDTGLSYMGARYYDGDIGRFLSQDPIGQQAPEAFLMDPQQLNMYSYARNNPMVIVDPTGMYNEKTGAVEEGDTPDVIVSTINNAFGIETDWATVQNVSFYADRFGDKGLSDIVGESLYIGTDITSDISRNLDFLNSYRADGANMLSLAKFAPGKEWDLKNSGSKLYGGDADTRQNWSYLYHGDLIRYDAPGNINYGYVAKSLGLPNMVIQGGAQGAQFFSDGLAGRNWSWQDNSGDSAYVQRGIDAYQPPKSWLGRLWDKMFN
jgi:RHS repeat-associated protein